MAIHATESLRLASTRPYARQTPCRIFYNIILPLQKSTKACILCPKFAIQHKQDTELLRKEKKGGKNHWGREDENWNHQYKQNKIISLVGLPLQRIILDTLVRFHF